MPTVAVLPFYRIGATPLALEIMRIYNAGSSVYASVYADSAGTVPLGNSDLVPIQADGNGLFPVVFVPVNAAYDIKYYYPPAGPPDLVGPERDTYQGIRPGAGGGAGGDSYQYLVTGDDSAPGYGADKLISSPTAEIVIVTGAGGYKQQQVKVLPAGVLDGKVKSDESDGNPGYLLGKIVPGRMIGITLIDGHQIEVAFTGLDYVPKIGGNFTGSVTFEDVIVAQGGCLFGNTLIEGMLNVNGSTTLNGPVWTGNLMVQGTFALPDIPGTGNYLYIDGSGNVTRTTITIPAADDHKVLASATDVIPGYLSYKLMAGSGLRIDSAVDPTYGEILSVSMINVPVPVVVPNTRVVVGNGTGVTSFANFTYTNQDLVVGYCEIESFFVSMDGPYAAFHNTGVDARNFRDGYSQHANGDVRLGAAGAYGAIKISDATKIIDTAIDTTLRVGGKMLPPGVEITSNTYQLPDIAAGEIKVIRFAGAAATTVTASATQIPRYRSSTSGLSITGSAGGQIDAAGAFGIVGSAKVAAITLIGIDSTHVQVQY